MAALSSSHSRAELLSLSLSQLLKHRGSTDLNLLPSSLRFFSTQKIRGKHGVENDEDSDGGEELDGRKFKPKRSSTKTKRAKSMARLINTKPWSRDLESSLASLAPSPSKTTVVQTLHFINSLPKAMQFFDWVQKIGFTHDQQSYFFMLEILGRARNLNVARNFLNSIERRSNGVVKLEDKFFNSLIRSYGRAGLFQEACKVFEMMKAIGVSPSVFSFNSLLLILLKRGRTNMAKSLFDEMLKTYGVTPDTYTFNILIRGFCKNSMVEEGFRFFKEMRKFNCDADVITYNTLVDGMCRAGKVRIAHNLVKGMDKRDVDLSPNVVTYTTLIRGYCMKQEIDAALDVFREMVDRGLKPNEITYNTLVKGLSEVQEIDKLKELLAGKIGGGVFTPDTCTFNTLMDAQCNAGNLNEALKIFEKMLELHVQPDSASYSALIRNLCQKGDFERAEELFDELSEKEILLRDLRCRPLVAAFNPMFEYLCRNGKTMKAEKVFRQLMKSGKQDPPSYKTLIMGHCREATFQAGYDLLVLMLRRDFVPDYETYQSLIDGLLQKGEPILAYRALESMLKSCHLPATFTFHSVLAELLKRSCASESASSILLMLETRIRQNIYLSTQTVRLLFSCGKRDKAYQIVGLLYDNGFMVEMGELIDFLFLSKRLFDAYKMLLFSLEKHQTTDVKMCSTVIEGLCKSKRLCEAFALYYELVEKGIHQQLSCIEELRIALHAGGKFEEANFVSKRLQTHWLSDNSEQISSEIHRHQSMYKPKVCRHRKGVSDERFLIRSGVCDAGIHN
ncbi:putative pentatricopeptide repeat-containing protein [Tripterygium wilfordii]|uniref:Putative pentatricopeptide repeat-containing protein n=1 Tax=Tripterygium wilfordii TaxID=458696 RepID=A0A7J7CCM4_TRIWF|nr:putative pentatricopeptide repeat-containing protein [Tripterygium wilfordii]